MKPPPPDSGGGFDIRASHVYYTAELLCDEQFAFYSAAIRLSDDSDQGQAAGKGEGPDAFAAAYDKVAKLFLEVWGRSIRSIGGVSVGLTQTANHYQASDWYARRQQGPPPRRELPSVLGNIRCKPVTSVKWTGTGDDSDIPGVAEAGNFPDLVADLARPAIKEGLRLGKTHDITPGADAEGLRSIGSAWHRAGEDAKKSAKNFADIISYLTDEGNSEWQAAMNGFCQSIWGTTAWGEPRNPDGTAVPKGASGGREWRTNPSKKPGERQPIIEVLQKTANAVKKEFDLLATVKDTTTETTSRLGGEAARATARDLTDLDLGELTRLAAGAAFIEIVLTFRSYMDKSGVDAAVDKYQKAFHESATALLGLLPELEEAYQSAPTYEAQEARAEAFGARSMDEFKPRHRWTNEGDAAQGIYQIDLASSEWLNNSHTVNKHVGLTDDQLAQRLRDDLKKPPRPGTEWPHGQPMPARASTFTDLDSAQRLTQYTIDKNSAKIESWLAGQPDPQNKRLDITVPHPANPDEISGRAIDKFEMKNSPFPSDKAVDVKGVETRLAYDPDLDPPFTVVTSMPMTPKK
ncbi:RNase A-like domain-containing protein [Streptomyces sp. NPDC059092]|uniref:RNase A-like domain-containing protein n=1 Tax=Streptomyces sp. NPDC059092 TaxID=3346725 RepID=UPI003696D640